MVGVDTSLSENIQLGLFGNYGDINLTQYWALHRWWLLESLRLWWWCHGQLLGRQLLRSRPFGATGFSGDNKRRVKAWTDLDETYTATKATTSYVGALRVGAPITWGGLIFEPQATAIWNHNQDSSYKESGRYRALHSRSTPIPTTSSRPPLAPSSPGPSSRRTATSWFPTSRSPGWPIGTPATGREVQARLQHAWHESRWRNPSNQETQNGVLVEGGIDYAIFQGPTSAWKLYAKGGAKIWA